MEKTFDTLDEDRCWELLGEREVGRLAVSVMNKPDIFPVNYLVDKGALVIRTAAGQKLAAATLGAGVAFEVDALDRHSNTGWSIVIKGTAEVIEDLEEWLRAEDLPINTWAPGERHRYMRITVEEITGRSIERHGLDTSCPSCLMS